MRVRRVKNLGGTARAIGVCQAEDCTTTTYGLVAVYPASNGYGQGETVVLYMCNQHRQRMLDPERTRPLCPSAADGELHEVDFFLARLNNETIVAFLETRMSWAQARGSALELFRSLS